MLPSIILILGHRLRPGREDHTMSAVATATPKTFDKGIVIMTGSGLFYPTPALAEIIRRATEGDARRPQQARKPSGRRTK